MYKIGLYKGTDRMSDLICENYPMLLVMSRFGIALGFGDKSVEEVCKSHDVDTNTFLAVVNLLSEERDDSIAPKKNNVSAEALVRYLQNSHSYFLDFRLPLIRQKLAGAIDCENNDIAIAILKYYDEYVAEVRKHMMYEEDTVFPYVKALLNQDRQPDTYHISIFSKQHDKVEAKLSELKNIIIKYYPAKSSNELNGVLFDIFSCAEDLASHNDVEDYLFIPVIRNLESSKNRK